MRNKLSKAFPELTAEFYDIFADRLKDNSFTDKRLNDAVNSIIDTCIYTDSHNVIVRWDADFFILFKYRLFEQFDKKMKLYSYDDVMKMNNEVSGAFERYRPVQIGNLKKPLFASLNDIQENNLVVFKKK